MDEHPHDPLDDQMERRLRTLGEIDVGPAPSVSSLRVRRPPRRGSVLVVVAVAVVVVVAGVWALRDDGDDAAQIVTAESRDAGDTWRTIAPGPLSPRDASAAVWTGSEMLVVGGSDAPPCGPDADCNPVPAESYLADGAAYDPETDSWRPIADAPEPLYAADAVWVDGQALVLAGWPTPRALYTYDPGTDTWTVRAAPPQAALSDGVVVDDVVVYASTSRVEEDERPDWVYDPASDRWAPLPPDPIGPATDRAYVFTGGKLVLFALPPMAGDGSWLFRAAILEPVDGDFPAGQWRMLPPSDIGNGLNAWFGVDGYAVNPTPGTHDDPPYQEGGLLDLRTEQWAPLPPASTPHGTNLPRVGAAGHYVVPGGARIFRPSSVTWHDVGPSPLEDADHQIVAAVGVWTGREVVAWGGYRYDGQIPTLTADGAAYTPPSDDGTTATPTSPPPEPGGPGSSVTEPTTVGDTIPQPPPPGTVSGTYDGIENIRLDGDRCPDMEHSLAGELTTSVGETWVLSSEYCGESVQSIWSGEGTFSFTLPDSSTLFGVFVSRAPLPTTGVPYALTISGGSGAHEGASGYCDLTVEIEKLDLLTQRQSGTFMCSIR
jgi:hypothetical protein